MLLYEGIFSMKGDGVKIQVEGHAPFQAQLCDLIEPMAHQFWVARRVDPTAILGQKGSFRYDIESGKQPQAFVEDMAHEVGVTGIAKKLQRQQRAHGMAGRDHLGARKICPVQNPIKRELGQIRQEQIEPAELGTKPTRAQIEFSHIGNRSDGRPCARRSLLVTSPGQPGEALLFEDDSDHGGTDGDCFCSERI